MRVLLINPPALNTVIENPDDQGREFLEADAFGDFPPLGALYVLTHLEAKTEHEGVVEFLAVVASTSVHQHFAVPQ